MSIATVLRRLLLCCLLCPPQAAAERLVLANLSLPGSVWPAQREAVLGLLAESRPAVVVVQDVSSRGQQGPTVCQLARELGMHCDFVTADPPSAALRRGSVMMSSLPVEEDGASLLHGRGVVPPVAAGFLRLRLGDRQLAVYSASLTPGPDRAGSRIHQAADLRRWMDSHGSADATVVCARFASSPEQLRQLMPGFATVRSGRPQLPHGVDVLYRPGQARVQAATTLRLETPPATAGKPPAGAPASELLGVVVELELASPAPLPQ